MFVRSVLLALILGSMSSILIAQTADTYSSSSTSNDGHVYGWAVTEGGMSSNSCCLHTYNAHVYIESPNGAYSSGDYNSVTAQSDQYASVTAFDEIALDDGGLYTVFSDADAECTIAGTFFSSGQQTSSHWVHATSYTYNSETVENINGCNCRVCVYSVSCSSGSAVCHPYSYTFAVASYQSCPGSIRVFFTSGCGAEIWWKLFSSSGGGTCY